MFDANDQHPLFTYLLPANKLKSTAKRRTMRSLAGYGLGYERVVTPRKARFLLGPDKTLPEPGYETMVTASASIHTGYIPTHLIVRNIDGTLVVVSAFTQAQDWEEVFGITV